MPARYDLIHPTLSLNFLKGGLAETDRRWRDDAEHAAEFILTI